MANKTYAYANANNTKLGPMICACCGKPIEAGQFRYRETPRSYVLHHRDCSVDDPQWAKLDKEVEARRTKAAAISKDLDAFMTKHGIDADDLLNIAEQMVTDNE